MSNKTIELVENLESDPVESDPVEIVENDDEGLGNISETSEVALNKYEFEELSKKLRKTKWLLDNCIQKKI